MRILSFGAAVIMIAGLLPSFPFSAAAAVYESGYDFNDTVNLKWDMSGKHSLIEYSFDPFTAREGHTGNAVKSFISLDASMFMDIESLTVGMWLQLDNNSGSNKKIFYVGSGADVYPYISFDADIDSGEVFVNIYDGKSTAHVSFSTDSTSEWVHLAFSFSHTASGSKLALYYNGIKMSETATDINLSGISAKLAYISDFLIDDLYIADVALSDSDISLLYTMELKSFLEYRGNVIQDTVPDPGSTDWDPSDTENPDTPDTPDTPETPGETDTPSGSEGWSFPKGLTKTTFSWLAYTFDGTLNISRDLNKQADAITNAFAVTLVDVSSTRGGRALTRRKAIFPTEYMSLGEGLLYDSDAFSIAMWVYREADKTAADYKLSSMNLLEFTGKGSLVFSPFMTDAEGNNVSALVYDTEKNYTGGADLTPEHSLSLTKTSLSMVNNKWTHYALTFNARGQVNIYVNGVLTNTVETGLKLSDLLLTDLKIMTGSSTADTSRYYIDDVYVSSKALDAADIRRIEYYGVSRFVTEVLADPSPDSSTETDSEQAEIDIKPDSTDELEDAVYETAEINDFVGTTFDDTSLIGADYNNSVLALVRNASLAQGWKNYGLALDGMSSYIRYPIGILNSATELTVSIEYNWAGQTNSSTQHLFDFSKKDSSVAKPTAYMYLDMGSGSDGLSLVMNNGGEDYVLKTDYTGTNKWVRVTVTLKNGAVKLYIDGAEIASGSTQITPAAIQPNFIYIGKSGVKGDPLFKGTVDEIYISDTALTAAEIQTMQQYGIEPYTPASTEAEEQTETKDVWDTIINGVIVAACALIIILIIVIVITIVKR